MRNRRVIKEKRTNTDGLNAALYIRVSSEHQAKSGLGLEDQERRLLEWCNRNGVTSYTIYKDEARTGKNTDRDDYNKAMANLKNGTHNVLVGLNLSRIARNVSEVLNLRDKVSTEGWNIVVLDGSVQFDTRTANGKLMLTMFAALAEWEADVISERTRDALNEKKQADSHRPAGVIPAALEVRIIDLVRENGLFGTAEVLNNEGVPTSRGGAKWHASTVARVVHRYETR